MQVVWALNGLAPFFCVSCWVSSSTAFVTSQEPRLGWLPTTRTVSPNFTPSHCTWKYLATRRTGPAR